MLRKRGHHEWNPEGPCLAVFNKDGTFKEDGGATKPTKIDADLTVHQIVTDLNDLQVWLKIPQKTDWRHVDLKALLC